MSRTAEACACLWQMDSSQSPPPRTSAMSVRSESILTFPQEEAPDRNGDMRTVIVFRLLPERESDIRTFLIVAQLVTLQRSPKRIWSTLKLMKPRPLSNPVLSQRRQCAQKASSFARYCGSHSVVGHEFKRWRIVPPGELRTLFIDPYDETANELIEAKGTATRGTIREAIGQLFDYRRHIPPENPHLAVLLPHGPSEYLVSLLHTCGIACIYETDRGVFERTNP